MMASSPPPELELKDDIIKLSVNGDEAAVRALLDSGKVTARWLGEDGVGPLHVLWPLIPPPFFTLSDLPKPILERLTEIVGSDQQSVCNLQTLVGARGRSQCRWRRIQCYPYNVGWAARTLLPRQPPIEAWRRFLHERRSWIQRTSLDHV